MWVFSYLRVARNEASACIQIRSITLAFRCLPRRSKRIARRLVLGTLVLAGSLSTRFARNIERRQHRATLELAPPPKRFRHKSRTETLIVRATLSLRPYISRRLSGHVLLLVMSHFFPSFAKDSPVCQREIEDSRGVLREPPDNTTHLHRKGNGEKSSTLTFRDFLDTWSRQSSFRPTRTFSLL